MKAILAVVALVVALSPVHSSRAQDLVATAVVAPPDPIPPEAAPSTVAAPPEMSPPSTATPATLSAPATSTTPEAAPAAATPAGASPDTPTVHSALAPLEPTQPPPPDVVVRVDLSKQRMVVSVDGSDRHSWPVSTARKGYRTPVGIYRPERMHKRYFSRKYDNAPMPYAIFFHKGWAIHGTNDLRRLGRPASHGCVRLHPNNARALFALVSQYGRANTRIVVSR